MNNKNKILKRIARMTRQEKPIRLGFIRSVRVATIGLCVSLLAASIVLFGLFIFDIFEKSVIEEFFDQQIYGPSHFLFEYIALAIVLVALFVYVYRKFDWPLVKEKNTIFGLGIVISLVLGFSFASAAEHFFFLRKSMYIVKDAYVSTVPIRNAQRATTGELLKASSNVIGTIAKINEDGPMITLTIRMKNVQQAYGIKESALVEKLRVGEKVALHIDTDGKTITKLKVVK